MLHSERRNGEVLVGYSLCNGAEFKWRTKRIGENLECDRFLPVFASVEEIRERRLDSLLDEEKGEWLSIDPLAGFVLSERQLRNSELLARAWRGEMQ